METPGIECRPIRDITGDEMFNEVWFTDARIPAATASATRAQGWQVAMGTLGRERVGTAGLAITMAADLRAMISAARAVNPDALDDPEIRERIARAVHRDRVHEAAQLPRAHEDHQGPEELARGAAREAPVEPPRADARRARRRPARPERAARQGRRPTRSTAASWTRLYSFQRYTSIGAGATEVQKNIIADRALLPRK